MGSYLSPVYFTLFCFVVTAADDSKSCQCEALNKRLEELEAKYSRLESFIQTSSGNMQDTTKEFQRKGLPNSDGGQIIAFSAYLSKPFAGPTFGKGRELVYDKIETNIGHAYNNYTGTFVAPVSGTYAFSWTIFVEGKRYNNAGDPGEIAIELMINNGIHGVIHADTETLDDDDSATGFVIKTLQAGDSVFTRSTFSFEAQGYIMTNNQKSRWTFSGFLIG